MVRERLGHVTSFELIGRSALEITVGNGLARKPLAGAHPWYVLIEASSQTLGGLDEALAGALAAALEGGIVDDASIAASLEQRAEIWRLRESIPEAQVKEGASIKHDVSVEVGLVPALIREATPAVEAFAPGARVVAFGHLGDGNIHFNVSQPVGADGPAFLDRWDAMNEIVHGIVARLGGSVFRRARRRPAQARPARSREGSGLACGNAPDQGGARSERSDEPGQGAVAAGERMSATRFPPPLPAGSRMRARNEKLQNRDQV